MSNNDKTVVDLSPVSSLSGTELLYTVQSSVDKKCTINNILALSSAPTQGGTGQTSYTLGDILYSSASNTLSKLAGNTTSTSKFLNQTGTGSVSAAPSWGTLGSGDVTLETYTWSGKPSAATYSGKSVVISDLNNSVWRSDGTNWLILSTPPNQSSNFNSYPYNLPNWRKAVAKVRAGTGRAKLMVIGDSNVTGAGAGSSGTTNLIGAFSKNVTTALASILNSYYAPAGLNSLTGDGGLAAAGGVTYPQYDSRVTFGTNWFNMVSAGYDTVGGKLFKCTSGGAGSLNFTPPGQIDRIVVFYVTNSGNGSFTVTVDGGSTLATVSTNTSLAVASTTVNCTLGSHTVNLNSSNSGDLYIIGIYCYNSTVPAIDLFSDAFWGAKIGDIITNTFVWQPQNAISLYAPDLSIVAFTINDSINGTPLSTYSANMQTLITKLKTYGDVVLVVSAPSGDTSATNGTLDIYIQVLKGLAITNNCPLLDFKDRWVSYTISNALGYYGDTLHPSAIGYYDEAYALFKTINV